MPTLENTVETLDDRDSKFFLLLPLSQALVWRCLKAALIGGVIGACLAGGGSALFLPKQYRGIAYLYLSSHRFELAFDPRFRNVADEHVDLTARRRSLEAILESHEVIKLVLSQVKDRLTPQEADTHRFGEMMETSCVGEVITITTFAADPVLAADIANAWARVARDRVNLLVAGRAGEPEPMEASRRRVQATYVKAQQAYNDFISREDKSEMLALIIDGKKREFSEMRESLGRVRQGISDLTGLRSELKSSVGGKERPARYADELAALLVRVNTMDTALRFQAPLQVHLTQGKSDGGFPEHDAVRSIDVALEQLLKRQAELEKGVAASNLQQEWQLLQGQVDQMQNRKRELIGERDSALETLGTVNKKLEEVRVVTEIGTGAVSLAAGAVPESRAVRPRNVFNAGIGFVFLAMVCGGAAFLRSTLLAGSGRSSR